VVGKPLPEPFVAFVHDEDGNPVEGVTVTFEVAEGDGSFDGEPVFFSVTDSRGRAGAVLTLGADEGINNNVVLSDFEGIVEAPIVFTASGVIPGRPEDTTVSGVVLDNTDIPLEGVTVTIEGTGLLTITDDQGQFVIPNAPVGPYLLKLDGSTTTRPGTWPELEFEIDIISGVNNTVGTPIFLPILDTENAKIAGGNEDVILTMKDVPGFSITVFANSATFLDGSRTGQVMVSQVHSDKVPMTPIGGAAPLLTWTLQPAGAHFNPPARVTYPNIDNLKPGQVVDIFSFDHELGEFINVGTGAVSEDGSVITSDPGVGIHSAGWGYFQPLPPPPTCADGCDDREICNGPELCIGGLCFPGTDADLCTACKPAGKACDGMGSCKTGQELVPKICPKIERIEVRNMQELTCREFFEGEGEPLPPDVEVCGVAKIIFFDKVVHSCDNADLKGATVNEKVFCDNKCFNAELKTGECTVGENNSLPCRDKLADCVSPFIINFDENGECTLTCTQSFSIGSCIVETHTIVTKFEITDSDCTATITRD